MPTLRGKFAKDYCQIIAKGYCRLITQAIRVPRLILNQKNNLCWIIKKLTEIIKTKLILILKAELF